jgi:uncharacterized cupin superfamily protein
MDKLITVTPAADVTDDYKKEAKEWTVWDSKNRKKFPYNYKAEERVLVIAGSATLTPTDGGDEIKIEAGDAVTFHVGFQCKWLITKRMKKYYAVFADENAAEEEAGITCDLCEADCMEESYFIEDGEQDICPACYKKDKKKYKTAEHQKGGEKFVEEVAKEPKKKKVKTKK